MVKYIGYRKKGRRTEIVLTAENPGLIGKLYEEGEIEGCFVGQDISIALRKHGGKLFDIKLEELPWNVVDKNHATRALNSLRRYWRTTFGYSNPNAIDVFNLLNEREGRQPILPHVWFGIALYEAARKVYRAVGMELPELKRR